MRSFIKSVGAAAVIIMLIAGGSPAFCWTGSMIYFGPSNPITVPNSAPPASVVWKTLQFSNTEYDFGCAEGACFRTSTTGPFESFTVVTGSDPQIVRLKCNVTFARSSGAQAWSDLQLVITMNQAVIGPGNPLIGYIGISPNNQLSIMSTTTDFSTETHPILLAANGTYVFRCGAYRYQTSGPDLFAQTGAFSIERLR